MTIRLIRGAGGVRARLAALPLAAGALLALPAVAETITGQGQATITKDVETVRNTAQGEARRDIIRAMLTRTIGRDRLGEVSPQIIDEMARQIRPDMITGQTAERQDKVFVTRITADIDEAWFRKLLSDNDIDSASQRADGNRAMVMIYIDRADGTASDLSRPAEVETTYDRRTGASYSDHSSVSASSKEAAASSSKSMSASSSSAAGASRSQAAGAYSQRSAGAYGASGPNGSVAARGRSSNAGGFSAKASNAYANRSSSAAASKASSAYAASSTFADNTRVDAEVHDDVSFYQHVVYQQPPQSKDGDSIRRGLTGALMAFDVQTADPWMALAAHFNGQVPTPADLVRSGNTFTSFLSSLKARNAQFFMTGSFRVTQSGIDGASNKSLCTGQFDASAAAAEDGHEVASGTFRDTATGYSPEDCAAELTGRLGKLAAAELGPQMQKFWRSRARATVGQNSRELAGYSLVLRGTKLDMAAQADLMDALAEVTGVQDPAFVSQTATELRVNVNYAGAQPLQFAIYQKLRAKPGFAAMQATVDGRSILLCLDACR